MKILITGGGALVYFLSQSLVTKGHNVVIVNNDALQSAELARALRATVVKGDATQLRVLEDAGIRAQDVLLAITSYDEDNLLICQSSSEVFGVRRTLALVNDPRNEELFHLLGVRETISVTSILSRLIEQRSSFDSISSLFRALDGKVEVAEAVVQASSPSVRTALGKLRLPKDTLVAAVDRGFEEIIPNGDTVLAPGDRVLVVTRADVFDAAMKKIAGGVE